MPRHSISLILGLVLALGCASEPATAPGPLVARVEVAPGPHRLEPGETLTLTATPRTAGGEPLDRAVTWGTDRAEVATVSAGGVVSAVGVGTARITAAAGGKEGHATVTVLPAEGPPPPPPPPPPGPTASVELSVARADLEEGGRLDILATPRDAEGAVVPGRVALWSSSAPGVVTVAPTGTGTVTALKPGQATITARIDGRTATAFVVVTADHGYELTYDWSDGGVSRFYRHDLSDPLATRQLVMGGPGFDAVISPDGSRIVWVEHYADDRRSLVVANRDGSSPRYLTWELGWNDQPAWSPDGERIVYRHWNWSGGEGAELWIVNTTGAPAPAYLTGGRNTGNVGEPAWSPLGNRIAFARDVDGMPGLWTIATDGTGLRQVTAQWVDSHPSWSPDGQSLAFLRSGGAIFGDIYVVSALGGLARAVASLPLHQGTPAWSPDGRLIAFASSQHEGSQIYTVWADGTRLALRTDGVGTHRRPGWVVR